MRALDSSSSSNSSTGATTRYCKILKDVEGQESDKKLSIDKNSEINIKIDFSSTPAAKMDSTDDSIKSSKPDESTEEILVVEPEVEKRPRGEDSDDSIKVLDASTTNITLNDAAAEESM